jgi:hypothetical protein
MPYALRLKPHPSPKSEIYWASICYNKWQRSVVT